MQKFMDNFSNLMMIGECLLDEDRVHEFSEAIYKIVRPGDVVLDVGTGCGILALLAARAGAKKVFAIENDPYIAKIARQNVEVNGLSDKVMVFANEAVGFFFKDALSNQVVDVVLMEMLDTGLIAEQQVPAVVSFKKNGVVQDNTKLLVERALCRVELANYDFEFYGLKTPFIIQARNFGAQQRVREKLSLPVLYLNLDFYTVTTCKADISLTVQANKSGTCNALLLTTDIILAGKVVKGTSDMNMPVIVPVEKEVEVKPGDKLNFKIRYIMGGGFSNFSATLID
jgi:predicted RNA methylase